MADDVDPRAGELVTANYGWTKPTVGASDDAWGGYLNADLDGIDSVVHGIDTRPPYVLPTASTSVLGGVKVDGTTISISGGVISGTAPQGPTISDTPPANPQVGALWWDSVGGQLYTRFNDGNSSQWVAASNGGGAVASTTAPLADGNASAGTSAAYARADHVHPIVAMNDNRIINGDMRIDQRNNGASGTATAAYTVDRWKYAATQASKGTWGQTLNAIAGPVGFPYYLGFQSSSAYTPAASDQFALYQAIEADMVSDFAWGTANAQSVTLSFWARSSLTGTFGGVIGNWAGTRTYPFSYSLAAANTWTKITVIIPGDTSGAWLMSGNAASIWVEFDLGSGATVRGPASAWASAGYVGATGSVSVVGTNGATFYVTGVKLEIGSVATPFNRQSLAKSMIDCQRYYQVGGGLMFASMANSPAFGGAVVNYQFQTMRASPTVTPTVGTTGSGWTGGISITVLGAGYIYLNATAQQTVASAYAGFSFTASAEL